LIALSSKPNVTAAVKCPEIDGISRPEIDEFIDQKLIPSQSGGMNRNVIPFLFNMVIISGYF
jgi:hypothetical protein